MPSVNLLDAMPSVAAQLDPRIVPIVHERATVTVILIERGPWTPATPGPAELGHLGLLVLEGWLWQSIVVAEHEAGDVRGAGDLARPWLEPEPGGVVLSSETTWTALTPLRLAALDADFARRLGPWPQVLRVLSDALVLHARWQMFLGGLRPRHERRAAGGAPPLGARRPLGTRDHRRCRRSGSAAARTHRHARRRRRTSVSSAVAALTRAGAVARRDDGSWALAYRSSGPAGSTRLAEPSA